MALVYALLASGLTLALLILPWLVWLPEERLDSLSAAGALMASLTIVSVVATLTSNLGYGIVLPLRVLGAVMAVVALTGLSVGIRRRRWVSSRQPDGGSISWWKQPSITLVSILAFSLACGIWLWAPALMYLSDAGVSTGYIVMGNNDVGNYVLTTNNLASSGFVDSRHLANQDYGAFMRHSGYLGASYLQSFIAGVTGKMIWQTVTPAIIVAVAALFIGLSSLGATLWKKAPSAVILVPAIGVLAPLTSYVAGQYFLAQFLGVAALATSVAAATAIGYGSSGVGPLIAGSTFGVYTYPHLVLPSVVLLPAWALLVRWLQPKPRTDLLPAVGWLAGALGLTFLFCLPAFHNATGLLAAQTKVQAGWSLPPMASYTMLLSPSRIGRPEPAQLIWGSWVILGGLLCIGFVAALRGPRRGEARAASALALGALAVCILTISVYGADRYQTWKMQSFLLPLFLVASLPSLAAGRTGWRRSGAVAVAVLLAGAVLAPTRLWEAPLAAPGTLPGVSTSETADLAWSPRLEQLRTVNVLLGPYLDTMAVAALVPAESAAMASNTYAPPAAYPETCTLTRASLFPGELADAIPIVGDYVLIQEPGPCDWENGK